MKTTLLFLSVSLSASLFGQNVYIPDANFKAYLVGNSEINTNGDDEIQVSEAATFDGDIALADWNITDLTGIESFTALTYLQCDFNQIANLDLSQNTALEYLTCSYNQLASLNVSQNTALTHLECYSNQLTSLDVSQNTALIYLDCSGAQLTTLDVTQNTALIELYCSSNQITSLDVTQNTALYELDCGLNQIANLDLSQNTALKYLWCIYNLLVSLDVSQNNALRYLECSFNQLTCLNVANGINMDWSHFYALYNPNLTCIEVDDAEWATANWTDYIDPQTSFSEDCNYPENCDDSSVGITELTSPKNLIQILDMMGRETSFKPNTPLIYVYDDGSIEKVFTIE